MLQGVRFSTHAGVMFQTTGRHRPRLNDLIRLIMCLSPETREMRNDEFAKTAWAHSHLQGTHPINRFYVHTLPYVSWRRETLYEFYKFTFIGRGEVIRGDAGSRGMAPWSRYNRSRYRCRMLCVKYIQFETIKSLLSNTLSNRQKITITGVGNGHHARPGYVRDVIHRAKS